MGRQVIPGVLVLEHVLAGYCCSWTPKEYRVLLANGDFRMTQVVATKAYTRIMDLCDFKRVPLTQQAETEMRQREN